jgi:TonB family protein
VLAVALSLALHLGVFWVSAAPSDGFVHKRTLPGTTPLLARIETSPPLQLASVLPADTAFVASIAPHDRTPRIPQSASRAEPSPVLASDDILPARDPPSDTGYYAAKDVDDRAAPIGDIEPADPDLSGTIGGAVLLRLEISARGTVDRVIVVRADPDYAFGPGAFAAFERARFSPARKAGIPVASEMVVELHYGVSRSR